MPLKIVRNDITKMQCDAIVNTAAEYPVNAIDEVGAGCDRAIHIAAGADKLIAARKKIGYLAEGEAAITPGFDLPAKYIIHTVSPLYIDGYFEEDVKLRNCYRNSLELALENDIHSIAFPLIATGSFGYPKEEGMLIALDEINTFLLKNDMLIYLVVFTARATLLGAKINPDIEIYINQSYVEEKRLEEYGDRHWGSKRPSDSDYQAYLAERDEIDRKVVPYGNPSEIKLREKLKSHKATFSEYLFYLIKEKQLDNVSVYTKSLVDKKVFSKIKNDVNYHPNKKTAMCLCIGARLSVEESKELLERAGYAFSPSDPTDIIFLHYIENGLYDMIDLDIELEEYGLPCFIS